MCLDPLLLCLLACGYDVCLLLSIVAAEAAQATACGAWAVSPPLLDAHDILHRTTVCRLKTCSVIPISHKLNTIKKIRDFDLLCIKTIQSLLILIGEKTNRI
jgi:hypothetical protein